MSCGDLHFSFLSAGSCVLSISLASGFEVWNRQITMIRGGSWDVLPTWTSILPNIPFAAFYPLLLTLMPNLGAGPAFVVAVVPFADVGRDLDFCVASYGCGRRGGRRWGGAVSGGRGPGHAVSAA